MCIVVRNERMQKVVYCLCRIVIVGLTMTIPTMTMVQKKNAHPCETVCVAEIRDHFIRLSLVDIVRSNIDIQFNLRLEF